MKINRFICLAFILGSIVFVSYYGGNISYALFYLSILLPVISFLYTVYVYGRFKLYQSIDSVQVVKGDWTPYSFVITNEDFITFRNIKVNFLSDKSTIEAANQTIEYSLIPSEIETLQTRIRCNYRGDYSVGVESIEVTDFLYLFKITYPIMTKLNVLVLPRVVQLSRLGIVPAKMDEKNPTRPSNSMEEALDTEVRKYYPGDSRKRIHWKASARMQELISRKYQHIPKAEVAVFVDMSKIYEKELKVIQVEDKILESVLAITNYYASRRVKSEIIYEIGARKKVIISSKEDFNAFYKACAKIRFGGDLPIHKLMKERLLFKEEGLFCVVVTHYLTKELYLVVSQTIANGSPICILLISDDISEDTRKVMDGMKQAGVNVIQIMSEDEIDDILSNGERGSMHVKG